MRSAFCVRMLRRCSIVLAMGLPAAGIAQDNENVDQYILDLVPTVLELKATSLDLQLASSALNAATSDLSENAQKLIAENGGIGVRKVDGGTVLSVASDILFGFDSATLSPEAKATLKDIAAIIIESEGKRVKVIGHTDAKGTDAYNRKLSLARAKSAVAFLIGEGVGRPRVMPLGRGEDEPVADNEVNGKDNPDGRAKNRRVEFVLPK